MLVYNRANSLLFHKLVPVRRGSVLTKSFLQHCIAFCLELVSWLPFRKLVAIGYFVTNFEYKLNILHGAREIPIGMNFVGDLVVICRVIFVGLEWRALGTGEEMFTFAD